MNTEIDEKHPAKSNGISVLISTPAKDLLIARRMAFSVRETAEMLGVSEKTVRRLINRKLLRSSHALRHLLIPKKEIERFLDETIIK